MTLGEKIRKYRLLNGFTQKELGLKVGFSSATADSRMRKYESNAMAPKADMRQKLADALNIDIEAISDIDIASEIDIMYVLFDLEEDLGMHVEKQEGHTALVFDDNNENAMTLISYLNIWSNQRSILLSNESVSEDERIKNYSIWKSHFYSYIDNYFKGKTKELKDHYAPIIEEITDNHPHAIATSDISRLLRKIIENGLSVSCRSDHDNQYFTFIFNEIINPSDKNTSLLFAEFLYEYYYWQELGALCSNTMQMTGKHLSITFTVAVPSFSPISMQTRMFMDFYKARDTQTDYMIDDFEMRYEMDLEQHYNIIADEIQMYKR